MNYLLDTSAIVHYLKFGSVYNRIIEDISPFSNGNKAFISVVTLGELKSLSLRNNWDSNKKNQLEVVLSMCISVPISIDIIDLYSEIDTFSYGLSKTFKLDVAVRGMGKNDIWIAATASAISAKLITIDKDFSHLASAFVDLILLSVKGKYLNPDHNT
jgi:predicted nucleic acid-binding protein